MSRRQLNEAAPELLSAAKFAVKSIQSGELTDEIRLEVLKTLQNAIDSAETSPEWKFSFVVTPRTWEHINEAVEQWYVRDPVKKALKALLKQGHRKTARRVYCDLDVDVTALKLFQTILAAYDPQGATSRAFDRLIDQMNDQIFNRPALEILAETGL